MPAVTAVSRAAAVTAAVLLLAAPGIAAAVDADMRARAEAAGIVIEHEHDPRRAYLATDYLQRDTNVRYMQALRYASVFQHKDAFDLYLLGAKRGHALSQIHLGKYYANGQGTEVDLVEAYKWFRLADEDMSPYFLEAVAEGMTPEQIAEAERLAEEFVGSYE